jgi:hypothetical protein
MSRTALWAPAHRVMQRTPPGAAQPPFIGPSLDAVANGIQDARLAWNSGGSANVPQVIGWMDPGLHPVLDVVPPTASTTNLAAAQAPTTAVPLTLVSTTGAGVLVSSAAQLMLPSLVTIPSGTCFQAAQPIYRFFGNVGSMPQMTGCYDAATMLGRAVQIHSAGNDSAATVSVVGWDCYGYLTHQTLTAGNVGTVTTLKTFIAIQSITLTGTLSGSNVSAGFADVFGMPFYAAGQQNIWGFWNNLIIQGTGTFVAGVTTSPSTAALGDVRGTFVPGSSSDGTKRLTMWQHPVISTMVTSGINVGMFGVAQF